MYKTIDFSQNGGFPATQYMTAYMQDAYNAVLGAIANMIGDKVILSGVNVVGGQTTNGWISIAGEILPFVGGPTAATFVVTTNTEDRLFQDNTTHTVYSVRKAQFGSSGSPATTFNMSDLVRIGTLSNMFYSLCPIGSVIPFEGNIAAIPYGWQLHTLSRGRVFIGFDERTDGTQDVLFDELGNVGGSKTQTLVKANLPSIQLNVPIPAAITSQGQTGSGKVTTGGELAEPVDGPTLKTEQLGTSTPLSVLQPYYVIGHIKKII